MIKGIILLRESPVYNTAVFHHREKQQKHRQEKADSLPAGVYINRYGIANVKVNFRSGPSKSASAYNAVPSGKYVMADFALGATIFDRQEVAVEIDREGDDFRKNLLTIRAERRLGLGVEDAAAIAGGDWSLSA